MIIKHNVNHIKFITHFISSFNFLKVKAPAILIFISTQQQFIRWVLRQVLSNYVVAVVPFKRYTT